jgi:hypothetical protein
MQVIDCADERIAIRFMPLACMDLAALVLLNIWIIMHKKRPAKAGNLSKALLWIASILSPV